MASGWGIVTRCPIELKMKRSQVGPIWHARIKYKKDQNYEKEIEVPEHLEKFIREAQNLLAGTEKAISDTPISVEVTSANVPDLTLIDLPGITPVAVRDQPQNNGERINRLIRKYITNKDTIILVVVPCNMDIATTEALKMAREIDPDGSRTFGILTKPDLVDFGKVEPVVSIINNKIINLNKGYMIVRCREQLEIHESLSLQDAIKKERNFFKNNSYFSTLYGKGKATIPKLAEKLTLELVLHIKEFLPQLEDEILKKLAETQDEIDRCGIEPPSETEQLSCFLINKITPFSQDIINLINGDEVKSMSYMNIFPHLRRQFAQWTDDLESDVKEFNKIIENERQEYEEKHRGREVPFFLKYTTFEMILKDQIKRLEEPAIGRLREISDLVRKEFNALAHSNFPGFPNLLKKAKTKIGNIQQVKELEAESMLKTQFKMELMIYTEDKRYINTLKTVKDMEECKERKQYGVAFPPTHLYDHPDSDDALKELMHHLKTYYSIATKRLADQVPLVIRYMVLQESAAQLKMEMMQLIHDKDIIKELLKEEPDITSNRNNLKSCHKQLTEALDYLNKF